MHPLLSSRLLHLSLEMDHRQPSASPVALGEFSFPAAANMNDPILVFFTAMDNQGGVIVKGNVQYIRNSPSLRSLFAHSLGALCLPNRRAAADLDTRRTEQPKLDLDLYIQNYRGRTRYDRLFLIGRSSVPLCVDALKAAAAEAKRGRDTHRYREAVECLRIAAPSEPEATFDQAWLESVDAINGSEITRLLAELKGYKNNLVKESIRIGNEELAKFYESSGDLNAAAETYQKMRPDVSTQKQIADVGRHLIRVSLAQRNWGMVIAHLSKMVLNQTPEEEDTLQPFLKISQGIASLGQERFLDAATAFLATKSGVPESTYNEIASSNDVAVYGGLLALASMDRIDLQTMVLDNSSFRTFLEREPHIRRAVTNFVNGRYSACISTLESYRADYLLDIYLQKHIPKIYAEIRRKCIVQYLIPFSCISLDTMNGAFGIPGQPIEEELYSMIQSGTLQAKINTIDKHLTTASSNPRLKLQASALEKAQSYEKQAVDRLRRMGLAAADLELKGQKNMHVNTLSSSSEMYEEYRRLDE
ncbi:26S proteasome subunit RPN7-domain-containing protein [Lasiosphaeria ovina]|uniref:COP9 signalosome complex subunit 1 n=1 Tax=Lasiosphaeria ovina TaxID=92902 RepID=A0AAE0ND12_9PEZI|nr:26S proteasome subunit RPN7-domain-containing protein [Lasiosphaeria ovina]